MLKFRHLFTVLKNVSTEKSWGGKNNSLKMLIPPLVFSFGQKE